LTEQLEKMHAHYTSRFEQISEKHVVASRPVFDYMARDYDWDIKMTLAGWHGHRPSPKKIATAIKIIRAEKIPLLLSLTQAKDAFVNTIAEETEIRNVSFDLFGNNGEDILKLTDGNLNRVLTEFER